jgi:ubiquinone/menaquinone biosynthesis C-methylase UbiE
MSYTKSARFYDAIYSFKDYEAEVEKLYAFIQQYTNRDCQTLLDVATGTGAHLPFLRKYYTVEGLDLSPGMLDVARQRLPDVAFHQASMVDFNLGKQFDVVTCLFSAIGYLLTIEDLNQTLRTFAKHLKDGGVAVIEPWLDPSVYKTDTVHATFVDEPDLKISRMVRSEREGDISVMPMHYMVATPEEGVVHFVENHRLRLFTPDQYLSAIWQAGFTAHIIGDGLTNRGLYVGVKD